MMYELCVTDRSTGAVVFRWYNTEAEAKNTAWGFIKEGLQVHLVVRKT